MSDTPVPRIEATNLSELDDIRHAFFTRKGGVSGGIYGSLNVGFGSKDHTANVARIGAAQWHRLIGTPPRFKPFFMR